jgi:peptide/nickel transport system substrate-binding protein
MKQQLLKSLSLLALVVLLAASLAACGPAEEPEATQAPAAEEPTAAPEQPTEAPAAEEPAEDKIVTFAWTQEPDNLNWMYSNMWFSAILQQLYHCWAWEFDDQNVPFPNLLTEIPSIDNGGVSEDGLVITMNLRDDIVWSDGTPITADDFVFTYEMFMDPGNTIISQYPYDYLEGVEAPDERTVVMTFAEPFASWQALFWHGVLPKHILEPVFTADGSIDEAEWNLAPSVGCGPFNFAEWESGSYIRFVKNTNYWKGEANLDEIYLQFVPDDASQTAALIAGDADLGTFPPLSDVPALQEAGLEIMIASSGYAEGWYFNFRDMAADPVKDVRVRQAIAMALDRQAITEDLLLGLTEPVMTLWDPIEGGRYVNPDLEPWPYDPDAARDLLEEAGYSDSDGDGIREDAEGNPLVLVHGTTTREIRQDSQAVAQQYLREIGIDLQIYNYDSDLYFGSYADGAPPALGENDIMQWSDSTNFPDPDHYYWLCSEIPSDDNPYGANYFGCDEELDALFLQQIVSTDPNEREAIFHQITQMMHDKVYWLGLWNDPDYWVVSPDLTGVKFSGVTPFYDIMEWDLAQ